MSKKKPQICCICGLFSSRNIGGARGNRISATTPATAGWYRIAQSAVSIANCMGLFEITEAVSGAHSVSLISAGISYGQAPGLIQLAHAPFSTPAITKARLIYHPTYSGNFAYLEVYLAQAKAIPVSVNLIGGQGWTLVAPSTAGAVPSGYSIKELTLAEGKIVGNIKGYAEDIAIGGNAADLASMRGQIGDSPAVTAPANLNDYTRQGNWFFFNAAVGENFPATIGGWLTVYERSGYIYQTYRVINSDRTWGRRRATSGLWTAWASFVASTLIGDGITVNNGILSVPLGTEDTTGLTHGDGLTLVTDSGVDTVRDVAIGGDTRDLASKRGYLVDSLLPWFPSTGTIITHFDAVTTPGNYHILWNTETQAAPSVSYTSNGTCDGIIEVRDISSAGLTSSFPRLMQRLTTTGGNSRANARRIFIRTQSWAASREWFEWVELVSYTKLGDGLRITNGIISVPEYSGATASSPATSGLVPPAAAGQQTRFLRGDGTWQNTPTQTSVSGNAGTATKLATARTIALSGDVTASGAFDGSGNLTLTAALKNSGATAGAYGPGANATPAFGGTFNVPQITVDAKGRVTAAASRTVKIPANPVATQTANGLLSAADKKKLDGFATSGIMRINYKSYQDFTLNANFTMPYDGIATLLVNAGGWGGLSLTVDGIEVGRARLYGEDNPSPCDSVAAIVRSGKIVKGITKEGHGISGHVRCFKCE